MHLLLQIYTDMISLLRVIIQDDQHVVYLEEHFLSRLVVIDILVFRAFFRLGRDTISYHLLNPLSQI